MKAYRQTGFTLIEMVAVIIILAIMAATALPRFVNLSQDARLSSIQGMAGGLRSAAALAKSQWLATNSGALGTVSMGATVVAVFNSATANSTAAILGFPVAGPTGIILALDNTTGYDSSVDPTGYGWRFSPAGVAASTGCYADYISGTVFVSATALGCS